MSPTSAAARFMIASVIAILPEAGPSSSATGLLSPVAIAWPLNVL